MNLVQSADDDWKPSMPNQVAAPKMSLRAHMRAGCIMIAKSYLSENYIKFWTQ